MKLTQGMHHVKYKDIREANMPDSPSDSAAQPPQGPPVSPPTSNMNHPVVADVRSLTSGSPVVNGVHNSSSGPTSPSNNNNNNSNQLPPACGARQLSKLKRFLTTLQQFGSDISPEIGERVRGLVMNLVNNTISIEEFHQQLQEATNFPLRPFVIPFLKANLPLLQHELLQCAQMAKQTPQQYLHQHEQILRDREGPGMDEDLRPMEVPESVKRKAHEEMRPKENGNGDINMGVDILGKPLPKRQCMNNSRDGESTSHEILDSRHNNDNEEWKNIDSLLSSSTRKFDHASAELLNSKHERDSDDWRHIHTMLQCIIGMVDKTKRAVSVLQQRSQQDREELIQWARKCSEEAETEVKRRASDLMTATIKQTEERVTEVKRRAEEAVSDVKRQAVIELQKAVRAAEEKANEAVAAAHSKMDKAVLDARRQATDEAVTVANHQSDSSESCWNCGRKATETCSGCNVARYCGSFCQHKDWENHHHVCGQSAQNMGAGGGDSDDPPQASSATTTTSSSTALTNTSAGSPPNAISRMTTPPTSSDPITSLSDYVMKTPST